MFAAALRSIPGAEAGVDLLMSVPYDLGTPGEKPVPVPGSWAYVFQQYSVTLPDFEGKEDVKDALTKVRGSEALTAVDTAATHSDTVRDVLLNISMAAQTIRTFWCQGVSQANALADAWYAAKDFVQATMIIERANGTLPAGLAENVAIFFPDDVTTFFDSAGLRPCAVMPTSH